MTDIDGERVLVLGGGGFIGVHTCLALEESGARVHGFGRRPPPGLLPDAAWSAAEFGDTDAVRRAVADADCVVHLIGGRTPAQSNADPVRDVEENLLHSLRLIDICREAGVRRIVFASSGGTVYGITGAAPIAEDHPTDPITAYGINKLAVEKYLGLARRLHGLDVVVLRIANPYGPLQYPNRAQGIVGMLLARSAAGQPVDIWGDGSVVRDFVHVRDVADAVVAATRYVGSEWIFNVGSGRGRSLREVVGDVARHAAFAPDQIRFLPGRAEDVPVNVLDISRIGREFGWHPQIDWNTGLEETAAWAKQDRS